MYSLRNASLVPSFLKFYSLFHKKEFYVPEHDEHMNWQKWSLSRFCKFETLIYYIHKTHCLLFVSYFCWRYSERMNDDVITRYSKRVTLYLKQLSADGFRKEFHR